MEIESKLNQRVYLTRFSHHTFTFIPSSNVFSVSCIRSSYWLIIFNISPFLLYLFLSFLPLYISFSVSFAFPFCLSLFIFHVLCHFIALFHSWKLSHRLAFPLIFSNFETGHRYLFKIYLHQPLMWMLNDL